MFEPIGICAVNDTTSIVDISHVDFRNGLLGEVLGNLMSAMRVPRTQENFMTTLHIAIVCEERTDQ